MEMCERLRLWLATAPAVSRVTRRVMPHWYWTEEEIAELRRRRIEYMRFLKPLDGAADDD